MVNIFKKIQLNRFCYIFLLVLYQYKHDTFILFSTCSDYFQHVSLTCSLTLSNRVYSCSYLQHFLTDSINHYWSELSLNCIYLLLTTSYILWNSRKNYLTTAAVKHCRPDTVTCFTVFSIINSATISIVLILIYD